MGVGVDPLTLVTDILTVACFEAGLFDEVFAGLVAVNSEGRVVADSGSGSGGSAIGFAFDESSVARFSGSGSEPGPEPGPEPMQAAGAAVLRLALKYRDLLLG